MTSWHSYPKIYNLGHRAVVDIFLDPVIVEEKVDGSQFSFGRFGDELKCRSRGMELDMKHGAGFGMFDKAVATVRELAPLLHDGWTYRGEYLQRPDHNTLSYGRTPFKHIIIFDVNTAEETYLGYDEKLAEATRIGLECVPLLASGTVGTLAEFQSLLETISVLGVQKIEGVVVKNYARFGTDKKVLIGKYVSEAFKEAHQKNWGENMKAKSQSEILAVIGSKYCTEARWQKAVQHLTETGQLTDSPKDIGLLVREIQKDFFSECSDEVKEALLAWADRPLRSGVVKGFPEWYKTKLLEKSNFKGSEE